MILKNKRIIFLLISFIGLILVFFVYTRNNTISNLSLISAKANTNGVYEAPESITFIEKLGLLYLTGGLSYEFGVTDEVIELGLQTILSSDLEEMDKQSTEEEYIFNEEEMLNILENESVIEETKESIEKDSEIEEPIINWQEFYSKEIFNTKDSQGNIYRDEDITVSYTTPVGLNKDNVYNATNIWQYNYRYLNDGLIGLNTSFWGSYMFQEEIYFDRAWTSLKWLCQDYLNCVIVSDNKEVFEAIVYNNDNTYYWYLYLDKLYNYDAFGYGVKQNVIAMTVEPINIDNAYKIMESLGLVESESVN